MAKCGGCGKFLSNNNCIRCCKCQAPFHRDCVNVPDAGDREFMCSGCVAKIPPEVAMATPCKGQDSDCSPNASHDVVFVDALAQGLGQDSHIDLAQEIRCFRNELSALRDEVRGYRNEISVFKCELKSHGDSISKMESRISSLEKKFEERIPADLDPLENTIAELKCQLNERDQVLLLNDVEIAGIPETKTESVLHIVKVLSTKLGISIEERDIVHAERVGSSRRNRTQVTLNREDTFTITADPAAQRPRYISVRFARRTTRDQVLHAARVRRGLTSTDLDLSGESSKVYINERLTRINRHLFYQARQNGSIHNWKYVWTKEGKILARKEDGRKAEIIRCEKDIKKIFG